MVGHARRHLLLLARKAEKNDKKRDPCVCTGTENPSLSQIATVPVRSPSAPDHPSDKEGADPSHGTGVGTVSQAKHPTGHTDGDSNILTLLNCVECQSGSVASCVCGTKYAVEMVVQCLNFLGKAAIILRHDGGSANKFLAKVVANAREHETQDECMAKCSSSWVSVRESMNRVVAAPCAAGGSSADVGHDRPCGHDVDGEVRSVERAALVSTRFQVRHDGVTAHKKVVKSAPTSATEPSSARWSG